MNTTDPSVTAAFIAACQYSLNHSLAKIRHCLGQLDDSHMGWRPFEEQNSITNIILHLCGNMRQWIISAAGDAPDNRNRPAEFAEREPLPKKELLGRLTAVISEADRLLATLSPEKLLERRRIQATDTNVLAAIFDSVSHLVGHTHQIVYITRLILGEKYKFQWVPKSVEQGAAKK
jgi:uncharacterized protein DUF1572